MQRLLLTILLCLGVMLPACQSPARAQNQTPPSGQAIQPFAPPTGFGLLARKQRDEMGRPLVYGAQPVANWHFTQWGAPGDFAPMALDQPGNNRWSSIQSWAAVHVSQSNGTFTETMLQDGSNAPCDTPQGHPSEFDLLIEPNRASALTVGAVNPLYGSNQNFPPLSRLANFTVSGVFTIDAARPGSLNRGCRANHAGAAYGITLVDNKVTPHEIFWYSVQIAHLCVDQPGGSKDYGNCTRANQNPTPTWYWTGTQGPNRQVSGDGAGHVAAVNFAITDTLRNFGMDLVTGSQPVPISADFLPRLAELISSGDYGIDPDLDDWHLGSVTFGQSLWGDTLLSTSWRGFIPQWTLRPGAPGQP